MTARRDGSSCGIGHETEDTVRGVGGRLVAVGGDDEGRAEVARVAHEDELISASDLDVRDSDLNLAVRQLEARRKRVIEASRAGRDELAVVAEEDLADGVRDFGGRSGGVPLDVVGVSDLPDGARMRVRHGRVPYIARAEVDGRGRHEGEEEREEGEEEMRGGVHGFDRERSLTMKSR